MSKFFPIFAISAFTSYIVFLYVIRVRDPEIQARNYKLAKEKNSIIVENFLLPFVATNKPDPSTYANANPINGSQVVPVFTERRGLKLGLPMNELTYKFLCR